MSSKRTFRRSPISRCFRKCLRPLPPAGRARGRGGGFGAPGPAGRRRRPQKFLKKGDGRTSERPFRTRFVRFELVSSVSNSFRPFRTRFVRFELVSSVSNSFRPFRTHFARFELVSPVSNSSRPFRTRFARFELVCENLVREHLVHGRNEFETEEMNSKRAK